MKLYTYLATDFVSFNEVYHSIQPISGIIQTLYILKYYYWIVNPNCRDDYQPKITGKSRERSNFSQAFFNEYINYRR